MGQGDETANVISCDDLTRMLPHKHLTLLVVVLQWAKAPHIKWLEDVAGVRWGDKKNNSFLSGKLDQWYRDVTGVPVIKEQYLFVCCRMNILQKVVSQVVHKDVTI